jgi:hypothetical protein
MSATTIKKRIAELGLEIEAIATSSAGLGDGVIRTLFGKYDEMGRLLSTVEWQDGGPDE